MKNSLYILAVIAVMVSCKPDPIETEIPQAPQRLVVSSQLLPEGTFVLSLSYSYSALKDLKPDLKSDSLTQQIPEELLVRDAEVILETPSGNVILMMVYPGVYITENISLLDHHQYTIRIHDRVSGEHITAVTSLKPQVLFDTVMVSYYGKDRYNVYYSFKDDPRVENWYVVNYYTKDNRTGEGAADPFDIGNIAKRMLEQKLDFDLISESQIRSGSYAVNKKFTNNQLDTLGITLSSVSKDYFEFLTQYKKSRLLINQLRGEVINLPTNIENGYGFFNMYIPDIRVIDKIRQNDHFTP